MKGVLRAILHSIGPLHRALSRYRGTLIHRAETVPVKKRHFGSEYGGWVVIPSLLSENSIVYSVGIGSDITFDLGIIERIGCHVHGFDPTPNASSWIAKQRLPPEFHYHAVGLAANDGEAEFLVPEIEGWDSFATVDENTPKERILRCPVSRLSTLADKLKHSKIDILKMDIEGFEYQVLNDIIYAGININQLLVEFHHGMYGHSKLDTYKAVEIVKRAGFRLFNVSNVGREYSFVRSGLF